MLWHINPENTIWTLFLQTAFPFLTFTISSLCHLTHLSGKTSADHLTLVSLFQSSQQLFVLILQCFTQALVIPRVSSAATSQPLGRQCSYLWSPPGSRTHGYWLGQCPPRQVRPKTGVLPKHPAAPRVSSYAPSWMNRTPKDKSIYQMRLSEGPLPFLRKEVNLANRLPCCLFQERIKGIF